jgi:lysyl-tRNA synthetase class 2
MEEHIDAIACGSRFLRTSPELFHKRMMADGAQRIYEIARCFRAGEVGRLHHPEYTMLEWYRTAADYRDVMEDTRALISQVSSVFNRPKPSWHCYRVGELFKELTGWNPLIDFDEDRFDKVLCEHVEPFFKQVGGAVVLMDYPVEAAALSRCHPDGYAERWELYLDGIEIANAYSELTDSAEQRARFEIWGKKRGARGQPVYTLDESFIEAVGRLPQTGGAALGLDRLLMWLRGAEALDDVLPFREVWV